MARLGEGELVSVSAGEAQQRDETHHLDRRLVGAEPWEPLLQVIEGPDELSSTDAVERLRMNGLEPLEQQIEIG